MAVVLSEVEGRETGRLEGVGFTGRSGGQRDTGNVHTEIQEIISQGDQEITEVTFLGWTSPATVGARSARVLRDCHRSWLSQARKVLFDLCDLPVNFPPRPP
jgi:hypothetical protein